MNQIILHIYFMFTLNLYDLFLFNNLKQLIIKLKTLLPVWMIFLYTTAFAQLENSKWQGVFKIPGEEDCFFDFKKDTVSFHFSSSGDLIETMLYTISNDSIHIKKIEGMSPCDGGDTGNYKMKLDGDKLCFTLIDDPCEARSAAFGDTPMVRIKAGKQD